MVAEFFSTAPSKYFIMIFEHVLWLEISNQRTCSKIIMFNAGRTSSIFKYIVYVLKFPSTKSSVFSNVAHCTSDHSLNDASLKLHLGYF